MAVAAKLTRAHRWEIVELGRTHARLRARDVSGVGSHPATCEYNAGLLSAVPELFGMPPARVRHPLCALRGADHCIFDVRWLPCSTTRRTAVGWAGASIAAVGLTKRAAPHRLALASVVPVVGAGMVAWRSTLMSRRGWLSLEASVREHEEATDRLASSLHDLVSDLREEEVLDKVVNNARGAVGGSEFALVLSDGLSKTSAGVSPTRSRPSSSGSRAPRSVWSRRWRWPTSRWSPTSRRWRRGGPCRSPLRAPLPSCSGTATSACSSP
ncbi:MAG: hypothetical protein WKF31_02380 [Thermoleophilaceae bacterium]